MRVCELFLNSHLSASYCETFMPLLTVIYWFGLARARFVGMQFWIKDRLWSESPLPCRVHLDSKILKFFSILYSHHVFLCFFWEEGCRYFNHTICLTQKPSLTENRCIDIKIV